MSDLSSSHPCILIVGTSFHTLRDYIQNQGYDYVTLKDIRLTKHPEKKLKHRVVCDFTSRETMLQAVDAAKARYDIKGVIATYENYILPAAEIAQYLGLPGIPIASAKACTDKFTMRKLFMAAPEKISPDFAIVENADDLQAFAATHSIPLILKPANLAKSLLVTKNDSLEQLLENYQKMMASIDKVYAKYAPRAVPKVIIEEFMAGPIHSVDAFVDSEGTPHVLEAVVDYQTGYDIGFDDNFHYSRLLPSKLSPEEVAAIRHTAALGCRALGMKNSPAHVEIIRTTEGPRIVEIGARNGGYRERMHQLANNIDITGAALALSLGKQPSVSTSTSEPVGVFELFPRQPGTFTGIANAEVLQALPSLVYFSIKAKPGDQVGKAADGHKMCAVVILHNADAAQFEKDLHYLNTEVAVTTK